ncbi:oxygen-insensitive NADPH nitroreductase [Escherichia coli]|nr:oxygen-insensitive NADPH nitroreductase [Escherichia coli]
MTPTIELICGHRSIRHFTDEPISEAQREAIINSARATSSSSFLQCSSIIRITDKALREELVTLTGGQKHVAQAAEFWVFCADFNRHLQICPDAQLGLAEQLLLGVVDTAMMAQNALIAAESLGLGGVYIGGLRNNIEAVTKLLKLPQHVLPLFGLCLGWPADRGMLTIWLAHVMFCTAYVAVVISSRLRELDSSIEEAAMDLGATPLKVFFVITLPMIMPAIISGWLLAFTLSLDDLVIASFVSGPGATTLPMLVFSSVRMGVNPEINALATLILGAVGIVGFIAWYLMARAEKQRIRDIQRARRG